MTWVENVALTYGIRTACIGNFGRKTWRGETTWKIGGSYYKRPYKN